MGCTHSASKKKKKLGFRCASAMPAMESIDIFRMMSARKENVNNNKTRNRRNPCADEDDIEPFSPTPSLRYWYDMQLEEGRRRYNAPSPVAKDDITLNNNRSRNFIRPNLDDVGEKNKQNIPATLRAPLAPTVVTVYRFTPLPHIIGKGKYSSVTLADMTVHMTTADVLAMNGADAHAMANANSSGRIVPWKDGYEKGMKNDGSSPKPSLKYLIACKEYALVGNNVHHVHEQLTKELGRLARLSFSSRLLKVLQVESVYRQPKAGERQRAATNSGQKGNGEEISDDDNKRNQELKMGAGSPFRGRVRTPRSVRIYTEYAKYGTLRDILLREMPQKFGKTYMHELTVRAYMREVLVALAFLHENDVLHTGLCAKNVYLMNHISSVYTTSFPAYIADLPAGWFSKVPAQWVRHVLALMDPACMQLQYDPERYGLVLNDSLVSHAGWNVREEAQEAGRQNTNTNADAALALLNMNVEGLTGTANNASPCINKSNNNNNINNKNNCELDVDDGQCRWVDDEVRLYLHENEYSDQDSLPLPSPDSDADTSNVINSFDLDGLTVVRGGSFAQNSRMPALPPLLSTPALCDHSSGFVIDARDSLAANHSIDIMKHKQLELAERNSNRCERNGSSTQTHIVGMSTSRKRRPLIKLGHYGLMRSILTGDGDNKAHKLGSVTHLAPESMQQSSFTPESDIYAFAMTFIEMSTPHGNVFEELRPKNVRQTEDGDKYDALWLANIRRYLQNRNGVPIPPQLSDECKVMLRRCLDPNPAKRPTAVELLQSKYFLLGYWVTEATRSGRMEAPWLDTNYEEAAEASGLPRLPSKSILDAVGT